MSAMDATVVERRRVAADTAVLFARDGSWRLIGGEEVLIGGGADASLPPGLPVVLAVPGEDVAIHWLDLPAGLPPAQASAVARLQAGDISAAPIEDMHVAAGSAENGLTCTVLVPTERMMAWLTAARARGIEPDVVIPEPLLLLPREAVVQRVHGGLADYRAPGLAFTLEPDLAALLPETAGAVAIAPDEFDRELPLTVADPVVNLRVGAFARRRTWKISRDRLRILVTAGLALLAVTLALHVTAILRYTFEADRLEAEAAAAGGPAPATAPVRSFNALAAPVWTAVQSTPNAEVRALTLIGDGTLRITLSGDTPATLAAARARMEGAGVRVSPGETRTVEGRPVLDLEVRP